MAKTTQPKKKSEFSKNTPGDKAILIFAFTILGLFVLAIILPVVYIILASFIDPITLQNTGLTFDFSKWTTMAYQRVLSNAQIWTSRPLNQAAITRSTRQISSSRPRPLTQPCRPQLSALT